MTFRVIFQDCALCGVDDMLCFAFSSNPFQCKISSACTTLLKLKVHHESCKTHLQIAGNAVFQSGKRRLPSCLAFSITSFNFIDFISSTLKSNLFKFEIIAKRIKFPKDLIHSVIHKITIILNVVNFLNFCTFS